MQCAHAFFASGCDDKTFFFSADYSHAMSVLSCMQLATCITPSFVNITHTTCRVWGYNSNFFLLNSLISFFCYRFFLINFIFLNFNVFKLFLI